MKLTKSDARHIGSFKEGAFRSWKDILDEVKANRLEKDVASIRQANASLMLTFD